LDYGVLCIMKDDLARAIVEYVKDAVAGVPVAIPAVVEAYYPARQSADIRLLLSRKLRDGSYDDPRQWVLPEIPVQQFAAGDDCYLYLPVSKGTTGTLLTMDCDLWAWVLGDSDTTRKAFTDRRHDLSDSVFMPGIRRQGSPAKPSTTTNAELRNGSMRVMRRDSGKIEIAGASAEVIAVLSTAFGSLSTAFNEMSTSAPFVDIATGNLIPLTAQLAIQNAKSACDTAKTNLDTMKVV
jgi:hypothetical protein